MTVNKAFKNFIAIFVSLSILLSVSVAGGICYKVFAEPQKSSYAVSKLGSSGDEVKSIQRKLSSVCKCDRFSTNL